MLKVSVYIKKFLYILPVVVLINNFPSRINQDTFDVDVTISGAKVGTNYLRVELYKDGSKNYFGETFNGKDWNNNSIGEDYFPIVIKTASTTATIQGRIGNPSESEYTGSGNYKLKIKRYTASGNAASDNEEAKDVEINYEISPKETEKPVEVVTETKTATSTPGVLAAEIINTTSPTIIPTRTPIPTMETKENKEINNYDKISIIPYVSGVLGIILIGIGGILFVRKRKKAYNETNVQGFK